MKIQLKIHIQNVHEGIKYSCDQCDQQFTQKIRLKAHMKYRHEA